MSKKQQQNLIGLIIALVGLIYVWNSYLIGPLNDNLKKKSKEITDIRVEIENLKRQSFELPKIKKQIEYLKAEVSDLERYLPKERELPGLLRAITRTAGNFQVRILNISPDGTSQKQNYTEHIFSITAQGNYHTIAKFLSEIGQAGRIISARNLSFSPMSATPAGPSDVTISVNFQLVAYTYKG